MRIIGFLEKKFLKLFFEKDLYKLLILLILTDFCFIFLHLIHERFDFINDINWSITKDRGFAEIFQYIKEFWIVTTLCLCGIRTLAHIYFSWSLFFFYLLLDDSLQFHERFGTKLSNFFNFGPAFGLRAHDFGEICVHLISLAFFAVLLGISYYRSNAIGRKISNYLIVMIFALVFFGIVFDMIEIPVHNLAIYHLSLYMETIEDGGEMLIVSLITWYVLSLNPGNE